MIFKRWYARIGGRLFISVFTPMVSLAAHSLIYNLGTPRLVSYKPCVNSRFHICARATGDSILLITISRRLSSF